MTVNIIGMGIWLCTHIVIYTNLFPHIADAMTNGGRTKDKRRRTHMYRTYIHIGEDEIIQNINWCLPFGWVPRKFSELYSEQIPSWPSGWNFFFFLPTFNETIINRCFRFSSYNLVNLSTVLVHWKFARMAITGFQRISKENPTKITKKYHFS